MIVRAVTLVYIRGEKEDTDKGGVRKNLMGKGGKF